MHVAANEKGLLSRVISRPEHEDGLQLRVGPFWEFLLPPAVCHTPIAMHGPSVSPKFLVAQAWLREPSQISSSTGGKRKDTRSSEMQNAWVTQRPTHVPRRAGEAPGKRWPSQISRLLGASQCLALCPPGTLQPCCSH